MMQCKIFCAKHSATLTAEINQWLKESRLSRKCLINVIKRVAIDNEGRTCITVMFLYDEAG